MARFRIRFRDSFDPTLFPRVEEVFQSESLLQAVVHGHLLLERALIGLISHKMLRPEVIDNGLFGRWSFHQKLALYVGLYDPPDEEWQMLRGFNELRNKLAHKLDDPEMWITKCLPWNEEVPPSDARSHVWTIMANLFLRLGIVEGIEAIDSDSTESDTRESLHLSAKIHRMNGLCRLTGRPTSVCHCERCLSERLLLRLEFAEPSEHIEGTTLELHFLHPHDSGKALIADVIPECSAEVALSSLTSGGEEAFLPALPQGRMYELIVHRTMKPIETGMTFQEAGAIDGDWIDIQLSGCAI